MIVSCGKSKQEIELEKAKIELEKTKLELASKNAEEEQAKVDDEKARKEKQAQAQNAKKQKEHEQNLRVGVQKKRTDLKEILNQATSALTSAENNLNEINEFQIGRSQSTKNEQMQTARNEINQINSFISGLKTEMAELEMHKTFSFQKKPKSLMEFIFKSAKSRDFSKFRYLCDPYGENEKETNGICYAEMIPAMDEQVAEQFGNGRIIGQAKINGNKAEIEFAFGPSSSRLETMKMVNRNGSWYLMGM
ncbi:MAG TPA: hypothetical protein DCS22_03360 [Flavobacteriaceae bacterium]|nr:hypothetical protein [Flavobacteriaceae bacterium]